MEYANKRFNRFWYNADKEPTAIDKTLVNKNKEVQKPPKSPKIRRNSLIKRLKIIIFGWAANRRVTQIIAPSYTSHNQAWKGEAPILNKNVIKINIIPIKHRLFVEALTKWAKNSKEVEPQHKKRIEIPNNKKQEITPPKTKYFSPLSVENSELRLKIAKT